VPQDTRHAQAFGTYIMLVAYSLLVSLTLQQELRESSYLKAGTETRRLMESPSCQNFTRLPQHHSVSVD